MSNLIQQSPLEKAIHYLTTPNAWASIPDKETGYYCSKAPEYTIFEDTTIDATKFDEPWIYEFFKDKAFRSTMKLQWNGTTIYQFFLISCDGGFFQVLQPQMFFTQIDDALTERYSFLKTANQTRSIYSYYFTNNSLEQVMDNFIHEITKRVNKSLRFIRFPVFDNAEDAEKRLKLDLYGSESHYTFYYLCDQNGWPYSFSRGKKHTLFHYPKEKQLQKRISPKERAENWLAMMEINIEDYTNQPSLIIKHTIQRMAKDFWKSEPNLQLSMLMNKKVFKERISALAKGLNVKEPKSEAIRKWLRKFYPRDDARKPGVNANSVSGSTKDDISRLKGNF